MPRECFVEENKCLMERNLAPMKKFGNDFGNAKDALEGYVEYGGNIHFNYIIINQDISL